MSTTWTPFDFIMNGEFADDDYIRSLVQEIRASTDAKANLLLVYQGDEVFRTLLYFSCLDHDLETQIQNNLVNRKISQEANEEIEKLLSSEEVDITMHLRHDTFAPIFNSIITNHQKLRIPKIKTRTNIQPRTLIGIVSFDEKKNVFDESSLENLLNELAVAVSASAQVYLRRLELRREPGRRALAKGQKKSSNTSTTELLGKRMIQRLQIIFQKWHYNMTSHQLIAF